VWPEEHPEAGVKAAYLTIVGENKGIDLLGAGGAGALAAVLAVSGSEEGEEGGGEGQSGGESVERSLDDPDSLIGATPEEIEALIPDHWETGASGSGNGGRYYRDPDTGETWVNQPEGFESFRDKLHNGPYLKRVVGRVETHWPLAGNPTLQ